jgi:plasmid stability protein
MTEKMKEFIIRILPESLHTALKIEAARQKKTMQQLAVELIAAGLKTK